jgi:hypothetical protein
MALALRWTGPKLLPLWSERCDLEGRQKTPRGVSMEPPFRRCVVRVTKRTWKALMSAAATQYRTRLVVAFTARRDGACSGAIMT